MFTFFKDKVYLKQIFALSIPIALQNLFTAILNIFDQLMVGWLDPAIADYCLSAVLLVNQIIFMFQIIMFAVCNTVNIFLAQYTQNGKDDLIPHRVGVVLSINLGFCIAMTLLCYFAPQTVVSMFNPNANYAGYAAEFLKVVSLSFVPMGLSITFGFVLRSIKRLNVPLIAMLVGVLSNIFFNYILMFGKLGCAEQGLVGAAWGTVISRLIEFALIFGGLLIFKYPVIASPKKMFYIDKVFNKQYFKMFFPIVCNELFWVLSTTVFLYVYDKLPDSQVVLAGVNIASCVDRILSVAVFGVGTAAAVLISNAIGEQDEQKLQRYTKYSVQFGFFIGLIAGAMTFASAFFTPSFFINVSPQAQRVAKILLMIYAFTASQRSLSFMLVVGILRSGGDTTYCMVAETIIVWAIAVPLVMVGGLVFGLNIYILHIFIMLAELLKVITFFLRTRKFDKWVKLKTT